MVTAVPPDFSTLLRRFRLNAGLTQEELAERARMSARAVSDLERGISTAPRRDTVRLLADALALSVEDAGLLEAVVPRRRGPGPVASVLVRFPSVDVAAPPALIGRAAERARLQALLTGPGEPALESVEMLLLAGEPGIGKTRLLQEAARFGSLVGWAVLHGGCQRRGGQEPYAPLADALGQHAARLSKGARRRALKGCSWLVRLLPELLDSVPTPLPVGTILPEQEARLLRQAISRFLANAAGSAGTLLLLDDLQWAPADTLDLLSFLLGRDHQAPLRIVGAYRDTDLAADDPLNLSLADLVRSGPAEYRRLESLSRDESGDLLRAIAPAIDADSCNRILEQTGGVPFFLVSSAQSWRSVAGADIPWDIAQSVRARLLALAPEAQEIVRVASLFGRTVERRSMGAVTGLSDGELLTHLDALCGARLLEEVGADVYRFPHDVVREAVEADVSASRHREIHRRIAAALEALPAGEVGAASLAWHRCEAGEPAKALPFALRAGDEAEGKFAHHQAVEQYRLAATLATKLGEAAWQAEAQRKLGGALRALGRCDEALSVLGQAAGWYETAGDAEGLAQTLVEIGRAHRSRGTAEEGIERIQTLLPPVEDTVTIECAAALAVTLANLYFACGRIEDLMAASEQACRLAGRAGSEALLAEAEMERGVAFALLGRVEEALPILDRAVRLSESSGNLESLPRALNNFAALLESAGRLEECIAYRRRAVAAAERLGDPHLIAGMVSNLGGALQSEGRSREARQTFMRALAILRGVGDSWYLAYPLGGLAGIAIKSGDLDEAERYATEGLIAAERTGDPERICRSEEQLAYIERSRGEPQASRDRLLRVIERFGADNIHISIVLPTLARAHAEAGELDKAEEVVDWAAKTMTAANDRIRLVHALRSRAHVRLLQKRWEDAGLALAEAAALAAELRYRDGDDFVRADLALLQRLQAEEEQADWRGV